MVSAAVNDANNKLVPKTQGGDAHADGILKALQQKIERTTINSDEFRNIFLPSEIDKPKLALIHCARLLTAKEKPFQLPRPSQISDGAKPLLFVAIKSA